MIGHSQVVNAGDLHKDFFLFHILPHHVYATQWSTALSTSQGFSSIDNKWEAVFHRTAPHASVHGGAKEISLSAYTPPLFILQF